MNDFSYDILDLLKKYDNDIHAALAGESSPQCLYAFSPLRENLFEWVEFEPNARILQIGSDYGSYTGILAERAGEVVVLDPRDENLEVNRIRHGKYENIRYVRGDVSADGKEARALARKLQDENPENGALSVFVRNEKNYKEYKPKNGGVTEAEEMKKLLFSGFDHVVLGSYLMQCRKEDAADILRAAANFLKPGGTLLAAAENEMGVRYLMGAEKFETAFLEVEFRMLFEELKKSFGGEYIMYYPVPDYRYPVTFYSDHYLPETGDVTNISARLDAAGLLFGSEEEVMAKACQNGTFTKFNNSFFGIWEKGNV